MKRASLHAQLRTETYGEHVGLEGLLAHRECFATLPAYVEYLQGCYAFQSAAERRLTSCGADAVIDDWPARRRAHLARLDLEALGVTPSSRSGDCDEWIISRRVEHILGTAYVLEGATLGGAVLLESLHTLGVSAEFGGAFLASYGHARGRMWRAFLVLLAEWEARSVSADEVVRAANGAFRAARYALFGTEEPARSVSSASRSQPPASR